MSEQENVEKGNVDTAFRKLVRRAEEHIDIVELFVMVEMTFFRIYIKE